ncbi:MAG: hypothetical protein KF753_23260, partial [Caldilineaceae bacterium]|nr:hypothetical protein [Caldilineaceae bacterium]
KKQKQILESIAQELKDVKAELQLLRQELTSPRLLSSPLDIAEPESEPEAEPIIERAMAERYLDEEESGPEQTEIAVYDWLTAQGIVVKNYREQSNGDAIFDQLALFLGERFDTLSRLHELIRRNLSSGATFTYNLSGRSQAEIADCTQFCTLLSSYAFLSSYKYNRTAKTIYATPQRVGKVINFFTGGWFERYTYLKMVDLLTADQLTYTCLLNPQITFPNGDDFELDLLFLVDSQPLWIECKTGDYAAYITKYSEAKKLLSVPSERSLLVILDIPNELTDNLTDLYEIIVTNEGNFLEKARLSLGLSEIPPAGEAGQSAAQPASQRSVQPPTQPAIPAEMPSSISTLLNKVGLRPVPEHRRQVIEELVKVVATFQQPMTMIETKAILAEIVQTSKSQLQDILNAVLRSECVLDGDGTVIPVFTYPFCKLTSEDPADIDQKCVESYARAILWNSPAYFDSPNNVAEFERVVGGKMPDPATMQTLREQAPSGE